VQDARFDICDPPEENQDKLAAVIIEKMLKKLMTFYQNLIEDTVL
jgi:hypothetical protein